MKARSKGLQAYLNERGIIDGSPASLIARHEYRREYKRLWRKQSLKSKEMRLCFTLQEYAGIEQRAGFFHLPATTYVRNLVISAQEHAELIPNKDRLFEVLQAIGMAATAFTQDRNSIEALAILLKSEELLMSYLSIKR